MNICCNKKRVSNNQGKYTSLHILWVIYSRLIREFKFRFQESSLKSLQPQIAYFQQAGRENLYPLTKWLFPIKIFSDLFFQSYSGLRTLILTTFLIEYEWVYSMLKENIWKLYVLIVIGSIQNIMPRYNILYRSYLHSILICL